MRRFIHVDDRSQSTSLPECLDGNVAEDNSVRVIEGFVDRLDLYTFCFEVAMVRGSTGTGHRCARITMLTDGSSALYRRLAYRG